MLITNTAAFVARMEAEAAAASERQAADEALKVEAKRKAIELESQRLRDQEQLATRHAPWVAPAGRWRREEVSTSAPNPLQLWRVLAPIEVDPFLRGVPIEN